MKVLIIFGVLALATICSGTAAATCSSEVKAAIKQIYDACNPSGNSGTTPASMDDTTRDNAMGCALLKAAANTHLQEFANACPEADYKTNIMRFNCLDGQIRDACPDLKVGPGASSSRSKRHQGGHRHHEDSSEEEGWSTTPVGTPTSA